MVLHTYVLRLQYSCGVVLVFLVPAGNSFLFYVSTYLVYDTVVRLVVLVFWLWREIVLKMRTPFYKKILLGYLFMIR